MGLEQALWLISIEATSSIYACRLRGSGSVGVTHFQVSKFSRLHLAGDREGHFEPVNLFFSTLGKDRIVPFSFVHILCGES